MTTDTRDRRAVLAVACPVCDAPRGETCRLRPGEADRLAGGPHRRLYCHQERRRAWMAVRDGDIPEQE